MMRLAGHYCLFCSYFVDIHGLFDGEVPIKVLTSKVDYEVSLGLFFASGNFCLELHIAGLEDVVVGF